jgi:hypothetical protein
VLRDRRLEHPKQALDADPASITAIELALDTAHAATIAPVWAALLTGSTEARGRGTIGDDVRDATERVPVLWFQDTDEHQTPRRRYHVDAHLLTWFPSAMVAYSNCMAVSWVPEEYDPSESSEPIMAYALPVGAGRTGSATSQPPCTDVRTGRSPARHGWREAVG